LANACYGPNPAIASNRQSFAWGLAANATGSDSFALIQSTASGNASVAAAKGIASGANSFALGEGVASNNNTTTLGYRNSSIGYHQTTVGQISKSTGGTWGDSNFPEANINIPLFQVGNGLPDDYWYPNSTDAGKVLLHGTKRNGFEVTFVETIIKDNLKLDGSKSISNIKTITDTYTGLTNDYFTTGDHVIFFSGTTDFNYFLPKATGSGTEIRFRNIGLTGVTIAAYSGDLVDDAATKAVDTFSSSPYDCKTTLIDFDVTNWYSI